MSKSSDKALRLENELIKAGLKAALETKEGRAVLWSILSSAGVHQQPFAHNALTMAFRCGKLDLGNQLLARILEADPLGYIRLQEERASPYVNTDRSPQRDADRTDAYSDPDPDDAD